MRYAYNAIFDIHSNLLLMNVTHGERIVFVFPQHQRHGQPGPVDNQEGLPGHLLLTDQSQGGGGEWLGQGVQDSEEALGDGHLQGLGGVDPNLGQRRQVLRADEAVYIILAEIWRQHGRAQVMAWVGLVPDIQRPPVVLRSTGVCQVA